MEKIIARGAEAIIKQKANKIIKERIKKSYRLKILDEKLRKQRTKKEAKLLKKASELIPVPKILKEEPYILEIELIEGKKLSEHLDTLPKALSICEQIGQHTAKLHDSNIIHGDLTTSNMILKNEKVYFIDFGLGFESHHLEDKAVDLHLLKQALEAKHFKNFKGYFQNVLEGYKISKNYSAVIKQLEKVEKRGRYKKAY